MFCSRILAFIICLRSGAAIKDVSSAKRLKTNCGKIGRVEVMWRRHEEPEFKDKSVVR